MKYLLATNNPQKLRELRAILDDMGIETLSMSECGIVSAPEETGASFAENAAIKARALALVAGMPAIADDSGLEVEALNGRPGVFSARYAGGNATDADNNEKLLRELSGLKGMRRSAKFVSSVCCAFPDGPEIAAEGQCAGEILESPRGENGFGYDPLFYIAEYGLTFAQMPQSLKNRISHRARALTAFRARMKIFIKSQK